MNRMYTSKYAHWSQTLRGHYGSAISHVQNGVKIISSVNEKLDSRSQQSISLKGYSDPCVPLEILQAIFARLDYQSIQVGNDRSTLCSFSVLTSS